MYQVQERPTIDYWHNKFAFHFGKRPGWEDLGQYAEHSDAESKVKECEGKRENKGYQYRIVPKN